MSQIPYHAAAPRDPVSGAGEASGLSLGPEWLRLIGVVLLLLSIGLWVQNEPGGAAAVESPNSSDPLSSQTLVEPGPDRTSSSRRSPFPGTQPHSAEDRRDEGPWNTNWGGQQAPDQNSLPYRSVERSQPHPRTVHRPLANVTPAKFDQAQYNPFQSDTNPADLQANDQYRSNPSPDNQQPDFDSRQFDTSPPLRRLPTEVPFDPSVGIPGHPQPLTIPASPVPALGRPSPNGGGGMQFSFRNAPWEVVLRGFAERFQLSLQLHHIPQGTFDYFDERSYSESEALDVLNGALLGRGALMIRNQNFLVVVAADAAIPTNLIPQVSPHEIAAHGRYEFFSVVFPIVNSSPAQMAIELETMASRVGRVIPLNSSNHLYVADLGINLRRIQSLLELDGGGLNQLVSHVVLLKNAPSVEVAKAVNEFLQGGSPSASSPVSGTSGVPQFRANGVSVAAEPTTNGILLRGRPRDVAEVENLIRELDLPPEEVLIQALLVEVELDNTHEFGVELGLQDSVLFNRSVVDSLVTLTETITNPGTGTQTTNQRIVSQTAAPGFNFNNAPLGNNTAVAPGRVGSQGLSNFGVGRVNGDLGFGGLVLSAGSESVSLLLRALAANFHVDVLSRPQIRTVDNHEAIIQIGQQVPVVDGVSVNAVGSANPVIRQEQAGIILKVIPHVGQGGRISIDAIAEKSQFNTTPGSGVVIFTDATSGNVIEAPIKNLTTAQTTVSVDDGQTIVLGGMITEETVTSERKVPWLGDVPLIGRAFRHDFSRVRRKELLIFLSPQIVHNRARNEELKQIEINRMQFPYQSAKQMHAEPLAPGPFENATRVRVSAPVHQQLINARPSDGGWETNVEPGGVPVQSEYGPEYWTEPQQRSTEGAPTSPNHSAIQPIWQLPTELPPQFPQASGSPPSTAQGMRPAPVQPAGYQQASPFGQTQPLPANTPAASGTPGGPAQPPVTPRRASPYWTRR